LNTGSSVTVENKVLLGPALPQSFHYYSIAQYKMSDSVTWRIGFGVILG